MNRRRLRRGRDGRVQLRLPRSERDLLRSLPGQLADMLDSNDPALRRLFPPGYADRPDDAAKYAEFVHGELESHHRRCLQVMADTVDADHLEAEQAGDWLGALNDLRLFLGTRIDVSENMAVPDPSDEAAPLFGLYSYLSWLEEQLVEALSG